MYVRQKLPRAEAFQFTADSAEEIVEWLRTGVLLWSRDDNNNPVPILEIPGERVQEGYRHRVRVGQWIIAGAGGRGLVTVVDDDEFYLEFDPDVINEDDDAKKFWDGQLRVVQEHFKIEEKTDG